MNFASKRTFNLLGWRFDEMCLEWKVKSQEAKQMEGNMSEGQTMEGQVVEGETSTRSIKNSE